MTTTEKPTIHILGGGPSGLSAAFHLTSPRFNPGWSDRYDVVVHQLGWRLGGKGATGRNADMGNRIEEHGIHLFGNMYGNSLHMMNDAYDELGDGDITTEFEPSNAQLVSAFRSGGWVGLGGTLPHNSGSPWEHDSAIASLPHLFESFKSAALGILTGRVLARPGMGGPLQTGGTIDLTERLEVAADLTFTGVLDSISSELHGLLHHELLPGDHNDHGILDHPGPIERLLESVMRGIEKLEEQLEHENGEIADLAYWITIQLDLLAACVRGTLRHDVLTEGIDSIDHYGYREWLEHNGCHERTLASSLPQAIPNTCMSYPMGDTSGLPTMAASAYLTFVLRQLMAPGDAAYFFRVSTGETIILPIYKTLVERGVRFEFFRKITNLLPSADHTRIDAIEYEQQTTTLHGPYNPIRTLPDGQEVWPDRPDYAQLADGDTWERDGINPESWWTPWTGTNHRLDLGPDDKLVVALPPAAQAIVCKEAADLKPGWKTMLEEVRATPTGALQLWTTRTTDELGWPALTGTNRWIGPTFLPPLFAVADFTASLPYETWPKERRPKGLLYFCGALQIPDPIPDFSDHGFPARMKEQMFGQSAQLMMSLGGLLPRSGDGGPYPQAMNANSLYCGADETATGSNRMRQQYYRANIDPNERYTLSEPGKLQHRLKSWESGYTNVALSSDAIYTGFNIGSFEGSVMSGMLASATLTSSPTIDQIIGYKTFHPNATGPDDDHTIDLRDGGYTTVAPRTEPMP
ncbi:MAG: NAD(P)-binding protein [Actinomycetota bacterium]